jgi:arylsulfatase A-like enzyme
MLLSRRHILLGSLALPAVAAKKIGPERPNVLLLIADNVPQWVLGAFGNKEIRTPHLDRLAQTGSRFHAHMASAPAAAPSRGSLLTGLAPGKTGPAIDTVMTPAGYTCNPGIDSAAAGRVIDGAVAGKPFFAIVNLSSPRAPYDGVAQKYLDLYAQTKFDTFNPDPPAPNARAGKEMLADTIGSLRKYAAAVTAMDDEIQGMLSKITQRKLVDDTLVIFTSTCGALLSHHGLWDAGEGSDPVNMYEESVSTPMIWCWPGRVPSQGVRPEIVSGYDLVPTLCDLLSVERPAGNLCGRSYALLATGKPLPKKQRWLGAVYAQLQNTRMARDERYKLVEREGAAGELYDLVADPTERANQYENGQYLTVKAKLSGELTAWKQKYSVQA